MPTRFSNKHGILIDNLFCILTENSLNTTSGILIKKFSDHQPYFTFLHSLINIEPSPKYIKINTQNNTDIDNFKKEIMSKSLMDILDLNQNANPSKNYEIYMLPLNMPMRFICLIKQLSLISESTKNLNGSLLE